MLAGNVVPHALHIGIAFSSEELVASICPYHILVHGELHVPPERSVLFRGHGEPGMEQSARWGVSKRHKRSRLARASRPTPPNPAPRWELGPLANPPAPTDLGWGWCTRLSKH